MAGEIHELLGEDDVLQVSAKSGDGVTELLEAIVASASRRRRATPTSPPAR